MGFMASKETKPSDEFAAIVRSQIESNPVMMYSTTYCGYCTRAKLLLEKMKVTPAVIQLDKDKEGAYISGAVRTLSGMKTVPIVYIGGEKVGGCDALVSGIQNGTVQERLRNAGVVFEDLRA